MTPHTSQRLNRRKRVLCALALFLGCSTFSGCASGLPRIRHESFQQLSPPPTVYVVSPLLYFTSPFMWTNREALTPHIEKAHQELVDDMVAEFERKGYAASGQLIDSDELPKDRNEELLRDVVFESYQEYSRMRAVLLSNLQKEKDQPLDYQLGRRADELAGMLPARPDWLFFSNTSAHVSGVLPYSEKKTWGVVMGLGLVPPGEDMLWHGGALVDSRTGQVLWFNSAYFGAHSLVFPSSRQHAIRQFLKDLPDAIPKQPVPEPGDTG